MGKTFKDQVNHFAHHTSHGEAAGTKAKWNRYDEADVPEYVLQKLKQRPNIDSRHGNNRHMLAEQKTIQRRHERRRNERAVKRAVFEDL
jgi:hypothetical protein